MTLEPGTRLGPYEIVGPLGAGGMGEVYEAHDPRLQRRVAIKVLPSQLRADPDLLARFHREARALSSLNHPHVCSIYDVGSEGEIDFLVMERLEGETLHRRLERGAMPTQGRSTSPSRSPAHSTPPTGTGSSTGTSSRAT